MHLTQAKTSKSCGQHCLAMLAGVSVGEAIYAVGHCKATTKESIIRAAKFLGLVPVTNDWQLPMEHDTLPKNAIVKTRRKGRKKFHWCCFVDGVYHDPSVTDAGRTGLNDTIVCWIEFTKDSVLQPHED